MTRKFIFFLIFIILIFLALHLLGWYRLYCITIWYDKLLHFLAGMIIVLIIWRLINKKILCQKILISFLSLLILAVLWEVFEFGIDKIFDLPPLQLSSNDTLWDLIFDIFGGVFGVSLSFWLGRGKL